MLAHLRNDRNRAFSVWKHVSFFFLSLLGGKIKERKKKKKPVISQLLVVAWQHSLLHLCVVQR